MIAQVWSGGQTGVDIAALRAARTHGIPTGGWMPRHWMTLAGPRPEYREIYGLREHPRSDYASRTSANVEETDATMRIALRFDSPGELCTLNAIRCWRRPHLDLPLQRLPAGCLIPLEEDPVGRAVAWIRSMSQKLGRPVVLNVAGNSERTAPGIEVVAEELLGRILERTRG